MSGESALPQKTNYNETLSKILLNLAAGAYAISPKECIQKVYPTGTEWNLLTTIKETCDLLSNLCSFYTIVVPNNKEIIVTYRGTKTKSQLFFEGWQSLQPATDFFGNGKVNKYFFRAHTILWDDLEPILIDEKYKDFNIIFTGHSLGGALASLGAIRTVLDGHRTSDQVQLYTFGQPRVGCFKFANKHNELVPKSYRIVHRLDIVPHLPACAKNKLDKRVDETSDSHPCDPDVKGTAYHHGTEIWYPNGMENDSKFYECLGMPKNEDFDCSDSLSFEVSKYKTYISDHRYYFNHKVPAFGKLGCIQNITKTEEENLINEVSKNATSKHRFAYFAKSAVKLLSKSIQ